MSELAALSVDELEDELATWASHLTAGMCRWLELVAEADRRGVAEDQPGGTPAWLAWRCGLQPRAAREHVRVARRLAELPVIHEAFASGRLSYAKVRALTRVAQPACEEELVELASALTAANLERTLRVYRRVTSAEAVELQERAYLHVWWDEEGSLEIRGRLAPEDGAVVAAALDEARTHLRGEQRGSAEPPTLAEALVSLAGSGSRRFQVVVHVDADTLAGADGTSMLEEGPAIAAETARRLACDAPLVHVRERDGKPLTVGRRTRKVPAALHRALRARDRTCRFPGCENRLVDAHHIRHWARGGETSLRNLVLLCRRHHRLVHEGGYSVEAKGARLFFTDPSGRPVPHVHPPSRGDPGRLQAAARGPTTLWPGDGDHLDLDLAVQAVFQASSLTVARS